MMTPSARKLAVCMPAFNAEDFIETSISSILDQTLADFTFIITDDCSTDGTVALLRSIDDPRVLLLENEVNLGPAATRNRMLRYCIEEAFEYMALMDADDVAFPERLQKQVAILDAHPSLAACGSSMRMEVNDATWHAPGSPEAVRVEALFANPIPTPSATCRVQALAESGLEWDPGFVPCADYYFWYRLIFELGYPASNTGEVDMLYTHSPGGVSHGEGLIRQEEKDAVVKQLLLDFLGIPEDFTPLSTT